MLRIIAHIPCVICMSCMPINVILFMIYGQETFVKVCSGLVTMLVTHMLYSFSDFSTGSKETKLNPTACCRGELELNHGSKCT